MILKKRRLRQRIKTNILPCSAVIFIFVINIFSVFRVKDTLPCFSIEFTQPANKFIYLICKFYKNENSYFKWKSQFFPCLKNYKISHFSKYTNAPYFFM